MDTAELLQIYDREQRIELEPPNTRREVSGGVIRHLSPQERYGFIAYSCMDESSADAEIEAQIAYFNELGTNFEWKVFDHDRPVDLLERLKRRGFEVEEPEALLVFDLENAPKALWTKPLPKITRIKDAAGVEQARLMEEAVWGGDHSWMNERLLYDLQNTPEQVSIFAVPDGDRFASAAWIYYHPPTRFASLWGGSTLPEYRGRGFYTALLAVRAREARERGFRFLTVDASPMSRPILEKHGFQFLTYSRPCNWKARKTAPDAD